MPGKTRKRTKAQRLERLQGKKPRSDAYDIVLDPEPLARLGEAQQAVTDARLFGKDVEAAERGLEAAKAAVEDAVERLDLLGLSREVYERLQSMHPPTAEQREKKQTYNIDAFLPALIAATVVEDPEKPTLLTLEHLDDYSGDTVLPGRLMSAKQADELIEPWNQAEVGVLWNKAVAVCTQVRNPRLPFRVRQDERLKQELAYCVPIGLPHSVFLSWDPDDQDKALAWLSEQNQKCPRCRTRAAEWDPKQGGHRHAYVADVTRCVGCEVIDMTQRDLNEDGGGRDLHGVRVGLVPNDELDADDDAEDAA